MILFFIWYFLKKILRWTSSPQIAHFKCLKTLETPCSGFTEVIFNEDTFLPACNKYCFHYQFDWTLNSTWSYFEKLWRQDIACYKIFTDKQTPFRYFSAFITSIILTTIKLMRSIKYNRFSKLTYILILHNTYLHHQNR